MRYRIGAGNPPPTMGTEAGHITFPKEIYRIPERNISHSRREYIAFPKEIYRCAVGAYGLQRRP